MIMSPILVSGALHTGFRLEWRQILPTGARAMSPRATFVRVLAFLAIIGASPAIAQAQAPSRNAPPAAVTAPMPAQTPTPVGGDGAGPRPDRTTASYGDWVLRCELSNGGERRCEVAQTIQDGRGQVLALLTAQRGTPEGQMAFTAQVGMNTTVGEPMRLLIEDQAVLTLAFRRCMPRGCFAEARLPEGEARALARRNDAAKLDYRDADGAPVSIPVSLRGLAPSLEALKRAEPG